MITICLFFVFTVFLLLDTVPTKKHICFIDLRISSSNILNSEYIWFESKNRVEILIDELHV